MGWRVAGETGGATSPPRFYSSEDFFFFALPNRVSPFESPRAFHLGHLLVFLKTIFFSIPDKVKINHSQV
jgi:hypothetical protein